MLWMRSFTILSPQQSTHLFFLAYNKSVCSRSFSRSWFTLGCSAAEAAFPCQEGRQHQAAVTQTPGANTFWAAPLQPVTSGSTRCPAPARPAPPVSAVPQELPGEVQAKCTIEQSKARQGEAKPNIKVFSFYKITNSKTFLHEMHMNFITLRSQPMIITIQKHRSHQKTWTWRRLVLALVLALARAQCAAQNTARCVRTTTAGDAAPQALILFTTPSPPPRLGRAWWSPRSLSARYGTEARRTGGCIGVHRWLHHDHWAREFRMHSVSPLLDSFYHKGAL